MGWLFFVGRLWITLGCCLKTRCSDCYQIAEDFEILNGIIKTSTNDSLTSIFCCIFVRLIHGADFGFDSKMNGLVSMSSVGKLAR